MFSAILNKKGGENMELTMEHEILKELREFRAENNKRWEQNDKRWQENDRRWEENDKRWEENDKHWQENDRRWEENEKNWQENDKRWEENDKRWEQNGKILEGMKGRLISLEEGRKKDRKDILVVLDTIEKSMNHQLVEMREYFDAKFDKVFSAQRFNEIENEQLKKVFYAHEKRLNFYKARLNYLEEWKEQFDMGEFTAV